MDWIGYTQLTNVREETSTHMANWLGPSKNESILVILKRIVDGRNAQLFDFYQVNRMPVKVVTYVLVDNCNNNCIVSFK
jgi:hypothetical protein